MNQALWWEQRLMAAADGVALTEVDLVQVKGRLHAWVCELTQALSAHQIGVPGTVRAAHVLAQQASEVNILLTTSVQAWERQWEALKPARQLAQTFEDRVMLLVYGKFNAGKSSLCNFLAERFAAHGKPVQYFYVASGQIVEMVEPLREGAVETTARLQGVCLGASLVLLDTPGLHSSTPENTDLTQRFIDSADAVLWLTSSTSPGQVQELDELARELHRGKPLLPIITRSDFIEEDEVGGEIVTLLRNKCPANRLLQEADVRERGQTKLRQMDVEERLLKAPVSVSVHTACKQGETAQALVDSGFAQVCAALLDIVDPARAYKQRKPAEMMLHHFEENVLGAIASQAQPALLRLGFMLRQERTRLQEEQLRLVRAMVRQVLPELPSLLERYARLYDVAGLCNVLSDVLHGALMNQMPQHIGEYDVRLPPERESLQIGLPNDSGYERLYETLEQCVLQLIAKQVDEVFAQCSRGLDALEASVLALQRVLAGQHDRLMHIKSHLRDGFVSSANVGEAHQD